MYMYMYTCNLLLLGLYVLWPMIDKPVFSLLILFVIIQVVEAVQQMQHTPNGGPMRDGSTQLPTTKMPVNINMYYMYTVQVYMYTLCIIYTLCIMIHYALYIHYA